MVRSTELVFMLSAVVLAATCVTGRSLRAGGLDDLSIDLPDTNALSQGVQDLPSIPTINIDAKEIIDDAKGTIEDASSDVDAETLPSLPTYDYTHPETLPEAHYPAHDYTLPEKHPVKIVIEHKEEEEEVPKCSGAAASCCEQSLEFTSVDDVYKIVAGQTCTYTEEIVKVVTPACANIHCWGNCGDKCAEKAVVKTSSVDQTLKLVVNAYGPVTWAVKEEAYCVCPKPVEPKIVITASASAAASTRH